MQGAPKSVGSAITLLLIPSTQNKVHGNLKARLEQIASRFRPRVTVESYSIDTLPSRFTRLSGPSPIILVLREGRIIGEAMGDLFPTKELERVVRRAVEWPAYSSTAPIS